ncbi:alpha/beta hydrolase [Streptomyces sp. NPDC058401]|uniref:alpha/beta hydrolase n=1 Tax=Streptomyces sp. NPDC058401 TaxID=3346480 RepID=UPI0036641162
MNRTEPRELELPVTGGALRVLRFGTGPRTAVAVHGVSASGMAFRGLARELPADWSLFALDLRGRGHSPAAPEGHGIDGHAADLCAAAERFGDGRPVALAGHSMGAYVALRAAVRRPGLFGRLLLIDGGLPLPLPEGADPDAVTEATLGPALARLRMSFPHEEAYLDFFRAHPALGPYWNEDIERYVRYDATGQGPDGAVRSRVQEAAVRADTRELLASAADFGADLLSLTVPTRLVYAPRGLADETPGFLPDALVSHWAGRTPVLDTEQVPDCNHYTIVLGPPAKTLADRLTG